MMISQTVDGLIKFQCMNDNGVDCIWQSGLEGDDIRVTAYLDPDDITEMLEAVEASDALFNDVICETTILGIVEDAIDEQMNHSKTHSDHEALARMRGVLEKAMALIDKAMTLPSCEKP